MQKKKSRKSTPTKALFFYSPSHNESGSVSKYLTLLILPFPDGNFKSLEGDFTEMDYKENINKMLEEIDDPKILRYIHIIVEDIHRDHKRTH